jgi:hypothetical protein
VRPSGHGRSSDHFTTMVLFVNGVDVAAPGVLVGAGLDLVGAV